MNCVFRAASVEQADILVAWLAERGIEAFVKDCHAIGTGYLAFAVAPKGVAVCVLDESRAAEARALLVTHAEELKHQSHPIPPGKVFQAICPECGQSSDFPTELYGTVQTCPHCRSYMDVTEPPALC